MRTDASALNQFNLFQLITSDRAEEVQSEWSQGTGKKKTKLKEAKDK